jgi:hypothetical protein
MFQFRNFGRNLEFVKNVKVKLSRSKSEGAAMLGFHPCYGIWHNYDGKGVSFQALSTH